MTHSAIARSMPVGAGLLLAAASGELAAEVLKVTPYKDIRRYLAGFEH